MYIRKAWNISICVWGGEVQWNYPLTRVLKATWLAETLLGEDGKTGAEGIGGGLGSRMSSRMGYRPSGGGGADGVLGALMGFSISCSAKISISCASKSFVVSGRTDRQSKQAALLQPTDSSVSCLCQFNDTWNLPATCVPVKMCASQDQTL